MNRDAPIPQETATVITVSDRCAAGHSKDESGPIIQGALREHGLVCSRPSVIEDGTESVRNALLAALTQGHQLILTTGGTGIHPRDLTPEATRSVIDQEIPGLSAALRDSGLPENPASVLSRGIAGIATSSDASRRALIVNLPGSPKAVHQGMSVLLPLVPHILAQLRGEQH